MFIFLYYVLYLKVSEKPFTGFEYECKNLEDIYLENIHNIILRHILFLHFKISHKCFPVNFGENSKNTFLIEHPWTTASSFHNLIQELLLSKRNANQIKS